MGLTLSGQTLQQFRFSELCHGAVGSPMQTDGCSESMIIDYSCSVDHVRSGVLPEIIEYNNKLRITFIQTATCAIHKCVLFCAQA